MNQIFISYSRKNSKCVNDVVNALDQNDYKTWIDKNGIEISEAWLDEISEAIQASRVFMLFWSEDAAESNYVKEELAIATQLRLEDKIKFAIVMLDDTPLPTQHIQAYDMKSGCSPVQIAAFVNKLPVEWKTFSRTKMLGEQSYQPTDIDKVSVLYDTSAHCRAYIVGNEKAVLPKAPEHLAVCLQFFRPVDADMLASVYQSLPDPKNTWFLHVTGPVQGDGYKLDDSKPEQWEDSRAFIVDCINKIGSASNTTLHFFTLTPNALLGGVTMPLYRFWHVKLYNFVSGKYVEVIDIPRS